MKTMMNETVAVEAVAVEAKATNKRDPLANFNKLDEAVRGEIKAAVKELTDKLGGDNIDYEKLLGALDLLNADKKAAKVNYDALADERKAAAKQLREANAGRLHDVLSTSDKVDYVIKSQGLTVKGISIEKITDKRFHVEITADTVVEVNGVEKKAGEVPTLKLGKKYVAFESIVAVNGMSAEEFLAA